MKKSKRIIIAVILAASLVAACFSLAACSDKGISVTLKYYDGMTRNLQLEDGVFKLPTPEREGYVFEGWFSDEAMTVPANTDTLTGDTTLYAKWSAEICVVTFDTRGGSAVAAANVNYGTALTLPEAPVYGDKIFKGWFIDAACTRSFSETSVIKQDMTLYAKWRNPDYKIVYNAGYKVDGVDAVAEAAVERGAIPSLPVFERDGYRLDGWYFDAALTEEYDFTYDISDRATGDGVTLYAKWSKLHSLVRYFYGSELLKEAASPFGEIPAEYLPDKTAEGLLFDGWFADAALTVPYEPAPVTVETDLYAKFSKGVFVEFYTDGERAFKTLCRVGTAVRPPEDAGYDFSEVWYTAPEGSADRAVYDFTALITEEQIVGGLKLYGERTPKAFVLTVTSSDEAIGSVTGGGTRLYGAVTVARATITSADERAVFRGWFENDALVCDREEYVFDMPARTVALVARFELAITRTVTIGAFDALCGSATGGGDYLDGTTVTLTATAAEGYLFTGWFVGETLLSGNAEYTFTVTDDVTITPRFVQKAAKLVFDSAGGSEIASIDGVYGDSVDLTAAKFTPARQGYRFGGWKIDGAVVSSVSLAYEKTVTAEWIYGSAGFTFASVNGEITATAYDGTDYFVKIPKTDQNGNTVVALGEYLFDGYENQLMSVEIPNTVEHINSFAFSARVKTYSTPQGTVRRQFGMMYLDYIRIPSSVRRVDANAFAHCASLNLIEFEADIAGFSFAAINYLAFNDLDVHCPPNGAIYEALSVSYPTSNGGTVKVAALNGRLTEKTNQTKSGAASNVHFTLSSAPAARSFPIDALTPYGGTITSSEELLDVLRQGYSVPDTAFSADYPEVKAVWTAARDVLSRLHSDSSSDLVKAHNIFDWITAQVSYDYVALEQDADGTISSRLRTFYLEGVFIDGIAVCDGYSKAMELLCRIEGIEVIRVVGRAGTGWGGHAWNKLKIDGKWYFADATWADQEKGAFPVVYHEYFLAADMPSDHSEENLFYYVEGGKDIIPDADAAYPERFSAPLAA